MSDIFGWQDVRRRGGKAWLSNVMQPVVPTSVGSFTPSPPHNLHRRVRNGGLDRGYRDTSIFAATRERHLRKLRREQKRRRDQTLAARMAKVCAVHCTVCATHFTECAVRCTVGAVHCTECAVHCQVIAPVLWVSNHQMYAWRSPA